MNIFINTVISLNSQMALGGLLEVAVGRAEGISNVGPVLPRNH